MVSNSYQHYFCDYTFHETLIFSALKRRETGLILSNNIFVLGGSLTKQGETEVPKQRCQTYTFDKKWNSVKSVVLTLIGCS